MPVPRLLSSLVACLALSGAAAAAGPRPNLLLLVAEDLGPRIGAFGDSVADTPNLDRLAAEGVRYTRVFTTSGVCAPSRAACASAVGSEPPNCRATGCSCGEGSSKCKAPPRTSAGAVTISV